MHVFQAVGKIPLDSDLLNSIQNTLDRMKIHAFIKTGGMHRYLDLYSDLIY